MHTPELINTSHVWKNYTLKQRTIFALVYAAVFNDGVSIHELAKNLGTEIKILMPVIDELTKAHEIHRKNDLLLARHLDINKIEKEHQKTLVKTIVKKRMRFLHWLSKIPFVEFIGITGSLAAQNPIPDEKGVIDFDLFVITSKNTLWILGFLKVVYSNLFRRLYQHPICLNYLMDHSFLEVHNPNLYVATEIKNMIPVYGETTYMEFIKNNDWVFSYYPHFKPSKPLFNK